MADDDFAEVARARGLTLVGQRPALGTYIADAWRRRSFALTLARYKIQSDNERNRLGLLWVVIRPLLNAAVYGLVFGLILGTGNRVPNFIPFLLVGVFVFEYFSSSFSNGAKAITSNAKLVQSMSFPRVLLPISVLLEQAYRMLAILVVLVVLLIIFQEPFSLLWFVEIPILLLMSLFNAGVVMIGARLSVHVRDLQQVIPFITRLLFYTSSIFYSAEVVLQDRHPELLAVLHAVPTYEFIALSRSVLIQGQPVDPIVWWYAVAWSVIAFVVGFLFFWRAEVRYGLDD